MLGFTDTFNLLIRLVSCKSAKVGMGRIIGVTVLYFVVVKNKI